MKRHPWTQGGLHGGWKVSQGGAIVPLEDRGNTGTRSVDPECFSPRRPEYCVTGTKSGKSRGIPINDPLLEALRRLPHHLKTDYIFWNHETETRFVSIKKVWATTLRKGGITNFRFHDLRHTFASYVQMGLGDLRATQLLLGHADPA